MKVDIYTKSVLTVIAIALVVIVFQNFNITPKVHANNYNASSIPVISNSLPLNEDGSLDVTIKKMEVNEVLDVNIKGISTYDELNVNIDEVGGSSVSSSNGLKVDLSNISTSDELDVNIDEVGGGYVSSGGPIKVTN